MPDLGAGTLQEAYKQELQDLFGISFNSLFCLNNMPIKRYADYLLRQGKLGEYLEVRHPYRFLSETSRQLS